MRRRLPTFASLLLVGSLVGLGCTRDYDVLFSDPAGSSDASTDESALVDGGSADVSVDASDASVDACSACSGGPSCTIVCAAGCSCSPRQCNDTVCQFACESGQTCVMTATSPSASQSTATCRAGSTCSFTCETPPCTLVCEGDAKCQLTCMNTGGSDTCELTCGSGTTNTGCSGSGGAARRACNASCPP